MDYVEWLVNEYGVDFVKPEELENGRELKPLDFVPIESFKHLKLAAERKKSPYESGAPRAERFTDITFVSCIFEDATENYSYKGSVVAVTPYVRKNDMGHADFKTRLTEIFDEEGVEDKWRAWRREKGYESNSGQ